LKRIPLVLAGIGTALFVIGLLGTLYASDQANRAGDGYLYDCVVGTPSPDCPQRLATINAYRTQTTLFEVVGGVGFLVIIAAAIVDVGLRRRGGKLRTQDSSRP